MTAEKYVIDTNVLAAAFRSRNVDFLPYAKRFGIGVITPGELLRRIGFVK
jgi:predicted nucleic acid-binding protein